MQYNIVGYMFREYIEMPKQDISEFTKIAYADEKDYDSLVKYDNELYETKEELEEMLKNKNILKYYINDNLVGCGFFIKVSDIPISIKPTFEGATQYYNHYDIGMWIDTPYRGKGYATKIISDLKQRCLKEGITPTCGCAADNMASKRTLEKNGFRSKYTLIEFSNSSNKIDLTNFVKENS